MQSTSHLLMLITFFQISRGQCTPVQYCTSLIPPFHTDFSPLPITLSKQPNHVRTTSSAVKHRIPPNHQKHRPSKHPHPKTTLLQTKRHPPHPPHPPCHLRPPRPRIPNLQLHPHPHSHQNTHILQLWLHCPRGPLQQLQIRLPSRRLAPTGLS